METTLLLHGGALLELSKGQYARYSMLDEEEVKDQAMTWLRNCAYGNTGIILTSLVVMKMNVNHVIQLVK